MKGKITSDMEARVHYKVGGGTYIVAFMKKGPTGVMDGTGVEVFDSIACEHYHVDLDNLIEFAKAGGKVEKPGLSRACLEDILKVLKEVGQCGNGAIQDDIRALAADRDRWRVEAEHKEQCRKDWADKAIDRLRIIDDLEAQLAKATASPKPKAPKKVRCVECEHCDVTTMEGGGKNTTAICNIDGCRYLIYTIFPCKYAFTPAAVGCGSEEQALRAELIRVTKDK